MKRLFILALAASTVAIVANSAQAQTKKSGGSNLPTCKQFCDSIGAGSKFDFRSCANNNRGIRCQTISGGPIKDKRPGAPW